MRYRLLGRSGLRVSEVALGTMTFGEGWGFGAPAGESERMLAAFLDAGGNFVDTANKYTEGESERIVGRVIAGRRERVVLGTKYTLSMRPDDPNGGGNSRKSMMQSVEASLRRLDTDYVDVLWVHSWDATTPVDEVMRGLDDLVRQGKVLYVGVSDTPAWVVAQANTMAELRGWSRFVGLQIEYSLIERTVERELTPMARALGLTVTAWAPLGGGLLTGKYTRGAMHDSLRAPMNQGRASERNLAIAREVDRVADELGQSSARVATAWLKAPGREALPILGVRHMGQLEDALGGVALRLSPEHVARLDAASEVSLGFPHEFLGYEAIRRSMFGDIEERLDR